MVDPSGQPWNNSDMDLFVRLERSGGEEISAIFTIANTVVRTIGEKQYIQVDPTGVDLLEYACTIGRNLATRVVTDIAIRTKPVNPGTILNVTADRKVLCPSNLEAAADTQIHKLLKVYCAMGFELVTSDTTLAVPQVTAGWTTNMTTCLDFIYKTYLQAKGDLDPERLPSHSKLDIVNVCSRVITFKYANRKNLSGFLKMQVKRDGNRSEANFIDIVKGWGTSVDGTIYQRIASAAYQLLGIISQMDGVAKILNKDHFMSGSDLRSAAAPPKQVTVREGNRVSVKTKGHLNVLKYDGIRFLLPNERVAVRNFNQSLDLENKIRDFDKQEIDDRDYSTFDNTIKQAVKDNFNNYFKLRRLARDRLYAIKEVRKSAQMSDTIKDSEFSDNQFVANTIALARSTLVDVNRKHSIVSRLNVDIVSSVFGVSFADSESESSA
jgi:hypothetical protein